ncbi:MAG TPA: MFS transporter [Acidimicrobiales bacterium]|jgi:MFS family permease|nr:MFS transporter [Acidimicrobiales bacterium]
MATETEPEPGEISLEEIEDAVVDGDRPLGTGSGSAISALRHRTFRIVFIGFFASNIGTWMQNVVLGAYAYDVTHSSTFVGVVIFAQLGPALIFPMIGGYIADKVDRKRFLIILSLEQLVFSLGVAWVVRTPSPSHLLLVLMVVMVGIGSAMFGPAYSAILPGLVGREDLAGAISLNSAQMNGSRVIGPIIGGVLFPLVGPDWVFVGNAATYLFVIIALMAVTLPVLPSGKQHASRWRELTAGITTARADPVVGRCLLTVFFFSLLALAFLGQLPVVAAHNLGIQPSSTSYGILYACFGTGALIGAISIGTVFSRTSKPLLVRTCLIGYAAALTGFALLRAALPAYFVVTVVGAFYFAFITALNTTLQTRLEDAVRGRVMALWIMGFGGTVGVGNLLIGPVVSALGITTVLLGGAAIALALSWYADVRAPSDPGDQRVGLELAQ